MEFSVEQFSEMGPRAAISGLGRQESVVFACEWRSQPHFRKFRCRKEEAARMAAKQLRALALACRTDIVVCSTPPCASYLSWLEDLDFAPGKVVVMGGSPECILPKQILESPGPVRAAMDEMGLPSVYVPHYCGPEDFEAARLLRAELFGSSEEVSLKYFDKRRFKNFCRRQGVPVVTSVVGGDFHGGVSPAAVEEVVRSLLGHYSKVIVRGTEGSSGSSVLAVTAVDVDSMMSHVSPQEMYLVEPFLSVVASPNDQWAICRDGSLVYLGISAQLFDGFCHVGNLAGQYFSDRISDYIQAASQKLVLGMAAGGYRGIVGIDYIITPEGIYPIENNARMNGSTYCLGVVERMRQRGISAQAWKFFRAFSSAFSFEALRKKLAPILYDGSLLNGVFPLECEGLEATGSFTAVVFGEDLYHIAYLESVLSELGIKQAVPQA